MKYKSILKWSVPGVLAIGSVAAAVTINRTFDRPGESAYSLIPADAQGVLSIDLVPAPSQVMAFAKLEKSLQGAGQGKMLEQFVAGQLGDEKTAAALQPLLKRSMAAAIFGSLNSATVPPIVGLIAVNNPAGAESVLVHGMKPISNANGTYFQNADKLCFRVAGSYLELTADPSLFAKMDRVTNGTAKPITTVASFKAIRSTLSPESNLKGFAKVGPAWLTLAGTVEDQGVKLQLKGTSGMGIPSGLVVKPLSATLLHKLPAGAYGVFSMSQIAAMMGQASQALHVTKRDFNNALLGDAVIAAYPSSKAPTSGADLMVFLDGANGAHPALAFKAFQKTIQKQLTSDKPIFGKPHKVGDVAIGDVSGDLKGMIGEMAKSAPPEVKPGIFAGKTITYGLVGQTVILSTSKQLLQKAISAYEGKTPSMAADPAFSRARASIVNGSLLLLSVDMNRILQGVSNSVTRLDDPTKLFHDTASVLVNGDQTIDLSAGAKPSGAWRADLFVSLDFNKVGKVLSQTTN